jgi:hypothetical protein
MGSVPEGAFFLLTADAEGFLVFDEGCVCACAAAIITLFTPFDYLADATSISSLFGFFVVALALLWRRHYGVGGRALGATPWRPALLLAWLVASAAGDICHMFQPHTSFSFYDFL